jgi:hypothetical protein
MLRIRSVICVPLIARQRSIGALYMENRSMPAIFTNQDLKPLKLFASQAAIAIENAALTDDLEERVTARTAALQREIEGANCCKPPWVMAPPTSYRHLNRAISSRSGKRTDRAALPSSVFDHVHCDHFKQINDTGRRLATKPCEITHRASRTAQQRCLARYGGEFVVLLVKPAGKARQVANACARPSPASDAQLSSPSAWAWQLSTASDASLDKLLEQVDLARMPPSRPGATGAATPPPALDERCIMRPQPPHSRRYLCTTIKRSKDAQIMEAQYRSLSRTP